MALLICNSLFAYDFELEGLFYSIENNNTVAILGKTKSYTGAIDIPESVSYQGTTYIVTTIEEYAFSNETDITSIVLPLTINFIGEDAFEGCINLNTIYITNIESWCKIEFDGQGSNPLTYAEHMIVNGVEVNDVIIPEGVEYLNDWAFQGFAGILSVTLPSSLKWLDRAFVGCENLNLVISNKATPPFVEDNLWRPFSGISSKAKLIVPKGSISSYYSHPVWGNSFKRISEDLNNITFEDLDVKNICVSNWDANNDGELSFEEAEAVTDLGNAFVEDRNVDTFRELIFFTGLTSIASKTFHDCRKLSLVQIPENVEIIYSKAFHRCYALKAIDIPSNVKVIDGEAFDGCTGLTSVNIYNGVETIGSNAFYTCKLSSIYIPATVKSIGSLPFPHTIEDIEINEKNPYYESPDGSNCIITKETKKLIFGNNNPTIPSGTLHIGENAFSGATFVDIYIPKSIETIGKRAFYQCANLVSISIPNNIKVIEESVFSGCTNLSNIGFSNNLSSIEKSSFANCVSLSSITIPQNVTSIGASAFEGCSALTTAFISNNITSIGNAAFRDCLSLSKVESLIQNPFGIYDVFSGISLESELYVPYGTKALYEATSGWNVFGEIIELNPQQFKLNICVSGNGIVHYEGFSIRNQSQTYSVNEGSSIIIKFTPDNGYQIKSVKVNSNNVTSGVTNNQYTISNITADLSLEVEFEAITHTLSIKATGYGSASYNSSTIRNTTKTFTVNEGTSATISFTSDNGYHIRSMVVDGIDRTSYISNDQYTVSNIAADITIDVEFEENVYPNANMLHTALAQLVTKSMEAQNALTSLYTDVASEFVASMNSIIAAVNALNQKYKYLYDGYVENGIDIPASETEDVMAEINAVSTSIVQLLASAKAKHEALRKEMSDAVDALQEKLNGVMTLIYDEYQLGTQFDDNISDIQRNINTLSEDVQNDMSLNMESFEERRIVIDGLIDKLQFDATAYYQSLFATITYEDVNYTVASFNNKTVRLVKGNYGKVLEVPATISYMDLEWMVTGVDDDAFDNAEELAAIIWHPEVSFNATISNPNLLLYVNKSSYAPASIKNVVVNGVASSITLTDAEGGNNFYCPQEFTAQHIRYSHNYKMTTGIGVAKGWETIALPFDVQTVIHEGKGEIVPFAKWQSGDSTKPFWLMRLEESGWKATDGIKANTPYIISMPNNSVYRDEFLLNGRVTFSSEKVTIRKTENMQTASYKGRTFVPTYLEQAMGAGFYVLNVSNDYETNVSGVDDGSRFVLNLRKVHPFEAYMITSTNGTRAIDISDGMDDGITEEEPMPMHVFNLKGLMIKTEDGKSMEEIKRLLPSGVYIINGHKMIVK